MCLELAHGGGKLKRLFYFLAIVASIAAIATACSKRSTSPAIEDDGEKLKVDEMPVIDIEQSTIQHKMDAYKHFKEKGGHIDAYFIEYENSDVTLFDLNEFLKDLGLSYEKTEKAIVIKPNIEYSTKENFVYTINYKDDMVYGHDLMIGGPKDEEWDLYDHYDSATDFIFQAVLGRDVYMIGVDEFDQIYGKLLMLTTPAENLQEMNQLISEDLSYSE